MKIGMFTSGYQRSELEDIFKDAKRFKYDYIELWGGRPHAFPYDLKRGKLEQLLNLRDKYEIPIKVYTPEHNSYPYNYMIGDEYQRKESSISYLLKLLLHPSPMFAQLQMIFLRSLTILIHQTLEQFVILFHHMYRVKV